MASRYFHSAKDAVTHAITQLKMHGVLVDSGRWQGVPTEGKPDLLTKELLNLDMEIGLDRVQWYDDNLEAYLHRMAEETGCNEAWANEHFAERVGGVPLNPDPSHVRWPWWQGQDAETKDEGKFTHTYSERFWPREAEAGMYGPKETVENQGIRYRYGDYGDVLDLLAEDPFTRQAYLPIFFPEDTGAVHRGRIPCSLGYHFLLRGNRLHCWYEIRSCDAVRHFRDDLYLAIALVAHTITQIGYREVWEDVVPGMLYFKAHSFHVHRGDEHLL